jgi:hypothetical protein
MYVCERKTEQKIIKKRVNNPIGKWARIATKNSQNRV